MIYELWDTESRNVIGEFDAEAEALAAVLEAVNANGDASAALFTLIAVHDDGTSKGIAGGAQLVELARRRRQALPA
jgi:hypothetical protein